MYNVYACILAIGVGNVGNVSEVIFAAGGLDIVGLQRSTVGVLHLSLPQLHTHTHTHTHIHTHSHTQESKMLERTQGVFGERSQQLVIFLPISHVELRITLQCMCSVD